MARPIPENPVILRQAPGEFLIQGRTAWYVVQRGAGCSCQAAQHGRKCWHVSAVKEWAATHPAEEEQSEFMRWALAAA